VSIANTLKPIAAVNAKILYSLMPPEIAHMCQGGERDKTRKDETYKKVKKENGEKEGKEMVACPIEATTVMFCSVISESLLFSSSSSEQVLSMLSALFSSLDDAVEESGFFKYQHIGNQYIITCPRAASPFKYAANFQEYPHQYLTDMMALGKELMTLTEQFFNYEDGDTNSYLKVGIAHGAAAGAVVGHIRAFYCIYGDTMNTSARLCSLAKRGHIHCS